MRYASLCLLAVLAFSGCDMVKVYQEQIDDASRALEAAKNDAERAAALSERGRAYSNKGRLSYVRKQIDRTEYLRLFALAIEDHDRAVALASGDGPVYLDRGLSYYDRAALVEDLDTDHAPWFDAARTNFSMAVQKAPDLATAHDYLGLVNEQTGRVDEAIANYTHVMSLDPRLGRSRLTDLYCNQGQAHMGAKNFDLAAADFEKSIAFNGPTDGCSCEPYDPLAYIYIDATAQYDKGWDLVHRAQGSGHRISSEYVERLERASGRHG
jgi:tetratricopeptide (TPR) repeat protein